MTGFTNNCKLMYHNPDPRKWVESSTTLSSHVLNMTDALSTIPTRCDGMAWIWCVLVGSLVEVVSPAVLKCRGGGPWWNIQPH